MERLIEGYRQFRKTGWPRERALYEELANGQSPEYLIISCCDSRADPALIFNARPGELFVLRNVANIVPPFEQGNGYHGTSSAIAFAVLQLKVRSVVVMGHATCGGIAAALDRKVAAQTPFLSEWISLLEPAVARCAHEDGDRHTATEREGVRLSLERLMSFPFIAERVQKGLLKLEGARFGIANGQLEWLDKESGEFRRVE
ncbi:MAG: carbonic anhydrase [Alphaproteobacteria bacterium]|nr:carbonic anhydrase [Alphaproteobacteria bacterium]